MPDGSACPHVERPGIVRGSRDEHQPIEHERRCLESAPDANLVDPSRAQASNVANVDLRELAVPPALQVPAIGPPGIRTALRDGYSEKHDERCGHGERRASES